MRQRVSMFNNSRNIHIKNSSLTVNVHASNEGNLDRLIDVVASNAILNAGGRADEVRCYPGTREEVIGKVERWMDGQGAPAHRMMWLSGPAGAGKSAIAQTVAERCQERGINAANFFFRSDATRNHAQPLVATLVYQLRRYYPALDELLADCLTATSLICKASIDEQLRQLIASPIQIIRHSSSTHQPIILIIDGLDECDNERTQEQILGALHALVAEDSSPFRVLVASRAEHHLVMSFNKTGASVESIFLNDEYRPEEDIRCFVIAKFSEIKGVHSLARTLGEHWPARENIDKITKKSSGQFIYAATVMRFIQCSPASPALSLSTVLRTRPSSDHGPLAQLDALYSHIFSKVHNMQMLRLILGAHFITAGKHFGSVGSLMRLAGYDEIEIESSLADLAAIVQVVPGVHTELVFYHASLSDYLQDRSRSGIYHIDVGDVAAEFFIMFLRTYPNQGLNVVEALMVTFWTLGHVEKATPELSYHLLDASTRKLDADFAKFPFWGRFLGAIEKLYFETDTPLFKLMLRRWIRFAYRNKINAHKKVYELSPSALRHYQCYRTMEWVKFVLRLTR
ncbi:hypothetical protein D9619_005054 [Psilocybe cf. subviscida]|uniref:NACHT domain-containing protein n=1 Tax=Psilocybe cf. subviscida TaxID=2480587 RepID=A0A8H5F887_9AGAR|nr:hypothetical protein D9619_005054 [Psilocybe cf. subviscida]